VIWNRRRPAHLCRRGGRQIALAAALLRGRD
jgi:hypothetical protein